MWIRNNWWKISIVIILGISAFWFKDFLNQKISLEKAKQEKESAELLQARLAKEEQTKKEYVAQRKNDCLKIYESEGKKWNNVNTWRYDELDDECYVVYKSEIKKSDAECNKLMPSSEITIPSLRRTMVSDSILCNDGLFQKSF